MDMLVNVLNIQMNYYKGLLDMLKHCLDNASGEIEVPVKMLVTRARTERPHGALLQFGTGVRQYMYRIGGRL